jgi:hypothetical protein
MSDLTTSTITGSFNKVAGNFADDALVLGGKNVPALGTIISGAQTLWTVGSEIADGNYTKAGAELAAGAAETVIGTAGFGTGALAREAVRYRLSSFLSEEDLPDKSGLRQMGEWALGMGDDNISGPAMPAQASADVAETKPATVARAPRINAPGGMA